MAKRSRKRRDFRSTSDKPNKSKRNKKNKRQNKRNLKKNNYKLYTPQKGVDNIDPFMQMVEAVSMDPSNMDLSEFKERIGHILKIENLELPDFLTFGSYCDALNQQIEESSKTRNEIGEVYLSFTDKDKIFNEVTLDKLIPQEVFQPIQPSFEHVKALVSILQHFLILFDILIDMIPRTYSDLNWLNYFEVVQSKIGPTQDILNFPLSEEEKDTKTEEIIEEFKAFLTSKEVKYHHMVNTNEELKKKTKTQKKLHQTPNLINNKNKYESFNGSAGSIKSISIYPTKEDFENEKKVMINPLEVGHVFKSKKEYFETHFRLIREDFMQSIREGFVLYLEELRLQRQQKNFNVSIFKNVRVIE
jgi:hypothetical protein